MKYLIFIILLICHLLILTHFRFTAWPEMFSYPYLMNHGFNLYHDIALPYEPGLPLLLASIYKVFGYNIQVLEYFTWSLILLSDLLIFLISYKIIGDKVRVLIPTIIFVILQPFAQGNMLWFDIALIPLILLGIWCLLTVKQKFNLFLLGLFLGMGFFIKQQLGVAIALVVLCIILNRDRFSQLKFFMSGLLIPTIGVLIYIIANNLINDYIFWTINVPLLWYPKFPGYVHWPSRNEALAIMGIFMPICLFLLKGFNSWRQQHVIVFLLFIGTFITAFPRFEFFRMQPAIALLCVLLAYTISVQRKIIIIVTIIPIVIISTFLLRREIQGLNQQPRFYTDDDLKLTENILKSSSNNKNVYLLGVSSLQYVLAEKLPPKPWVDNYVWYLEIPGVQDKVIEGFTKTSPEFIFQRNPSLGNWYDLGVYQPKQVVGYINKNYEKEALINGGIQVWKKKN